jgi:hypothetical protein
LPFKCNLQRYTAAEVSSQFNTALLELLRWG